MSATLYKHEVGELTARIALHLPGFRVRPSQQAMMDSVVDVLCRARPEDADKDDCTGAHVGCIEAPTGTGKTLGYAIPAWVVAKATGRKVVVSSATVALQEQFIIKDLPLIAKATGDKLKFAIAKGRGRYACTRNLLRLTGETVQDDLFGGTTWEFRPDADDVETVKALAAQFSSGAWDGDRDTLKSAVKDRVWAQMTTDRHSCTGNACPNVRQCSYMQARAKFQVADVIVANHDLVLADLKMGGGRILPDPSKTFYIMDEAHHLPTKAVGAFSGSHSLNGAIKWVSQVPKAIRKAETYLARGTKFDPPKGVAQTLSEKLDVLHEALDRLPLFRNADPKGKNPVVLRYERGEIDDGMASLGGEIFQLSDDLVLALQEIKTLVEERAESAEDKGEHVISELGFLIGRLESITETWRLMVARTELKQVPVAKWIALGKVGQVFDYEINAGLISAAEKLLQMFWRRASAVLLTSATLTGVGGFRMILRRSGLYKFPETMTIKLDSPFDYQNNAKLVLPTMKASPKDADAHTREIIAMLPRLIEDNGEGSLVLFSSRKQMESVFQAVPDDFRKRVLMQNVYSKNEIIKKHCSRIDKSRSSIIFGLDSFSEGVDLRGKYCSHVVIAKIPFATPADPMEEATAEWITALGGNPFLDLVVPAASIKLVQSTGRLLRTESDCGIVTILDNRLKTQRYGQAILKALPPFRIEATG